MNYSEDFKKQVLLELKKGSTIATVSKLFSVGKATIQSWKSSFELSRELSSFSRRKIDYEELQHYVGTHPNIPLKEVARHFDVTSQGIEYALKRLKITRCSPLARKIDREELKRYVAMHPNATLREIASHLGATIPGIRYVLKRLEITRCRSSCRKINYEELNHFVVMHPNISLKEIANHFEVTSSAINQALKQLKITRPRKINDEELKCYVVQHPNASLAEIGKYFGVSGPSIWSALKRLKITRQRPSRGRKIKYEELRDYIEKHTNALSKEIAEHFGVTDAAISSAIKRLKITRQRPSVNRKINEEDLERYVVGHPNAFTKEIAEHFGVSVSGIASALRRLKINRQHPSRGRKINDEELKRYVAGHPNAFLTEIGKHFGVSDSGIASALKRLKISRQRSSVGRKINDEELKRYVVRHPDDTLAEIGKNFGISGSWIGSALKRLKITRRRPSLGRKINDKELKSYVVRHPNATLREIGKHFGVSCSGIGNALKRLKITRINFRDAEREIKVLRECLKQLEEENRYLKHMFAKLNLEPDVLKNIVK